LTATRNLRRNKRALVQNERPLACGVPSMIDS
jgi:hypothetical protein